ncbi:protein jag [candidate division KSB1 bacterium]
MKSIMDTNEKITDVVKKFLERLNIVPDSIEVKEHKLHPIFSIQTKNSDLLIGNQGETLQAINHILKKIINRGDKEEVRFIVDVNKYQEHKLEELEKQAELLADRVRAFKHDVELDPMNAYERMVVHALFTNDPHIETSSSGEGKFRRIVLKYSGE